MKTPLSSQVGNFVLIDAFIVLSRVLSMVLFLRASCCFPAEKKTRSIPPPDAGQPWNCLHILTTSGYVWLVVVYYEWIKREPKIRGIYECRCDERLQTKTKKFTRLPYTGLVLELEHLKIETRLISERFANAMGECEN